MILLGSKKLQTESTVVVRSMAKRRLFTQGYGRNKLRVITEGVDGDSGRGNKFF